MTRKVTSRWIRDSSRVYELLGPPSNRACQWLPAAAPGCGPNPRRGRHLGALRGQAAVVRVNLNDRTHRHRDWQPLPVAGHWAFQVSAGPLRPRDWPRLALLPV